MSRINMGAEASKEEKSHVKTSRNKSSEATSSGSGDDITYCGFDISALPEELLFHVLTFVPAKDVVKICSCVSKHWLALCRDQSFWRRKCERERRYLPGVMGPLPEDFMVFYFKNPYVRNLLCNTSAESFQHWNISDRHMLSVEENHAGSDPIADHVPATERQGSKIQNWVTSYTYSEMGQKVALLEKGCSEGVLDDLRPPIHVSAWCSARWDCGSKFFLKVQLLGGDGKIVSEANKEFDMVDGTLRRKWHKVEHTFTDYGPGVRIVLFVMGGVDTQFWAGNYGSKFTLPCLRFAFQKD